MAAREEFLTIPLDGGHVTRRDPFMVEPPELLGAVNVQFGVQPGVPYKIRGYEPVADLNDGSTTLVHGIARSGAQHVVMRDHTIGCAVVDAQDNTIRSLSSLNSPAASQNGYVPIQVVDTFRPFLHPYAGVGKHAIAYSPTTGFTYVAACISRSIANLAAATFDLWLAIYSDNDGVRKVVFQPQIIASNIGQYLVTPLFVSTHGVNGAAVFYSAAPGSFAITMRRITHSGLTFTVGSAVTVFTPIAGSDVDGFAFASDDDPQHVWMCGHAASAATTVRIARYNVITAAQPFNNYINELTTNPEFGIDIVTYSDGTRKVWASWWDGTAVRAANLNADLTSPGVPVTVLSSAKPGVPLIRGHQPGAIGTAGALVALSVDGTVVGTPPDPTQTTFVQVLLNGTLAGSTVVPWSHAYGRGARYAGHTGAPCALFALHRWYGGTSGTERLTDPSIELWTTSTGGLGGSPAGVMTPIARFAVDDFDDTQATSLNFTEQLHCMAAAGDSILFANIAFDASLTCRAFELAGIGAVTVPRAVTETSGLSTLAASLVTSFDGLELAEISPMHRPKLNVSATGGSGTMLNGTYSFRAVITWVDARGNLHRGAPSDAVTISPVNTQPRVWVTIADTMHEGVRVTRYRAELYMTFDDGAVFYLVTRASPASFNDGACWRFDTITLPEPTNPQIYSTGDATDEIVAECPSPAWDMTIVGDRIWMIDADRRSRAFYTKQKATGIAFEFNPALEVVFPADAGKLIAVRELDGRPHFFAENGVYTVFGEGPNNFGVGTPFSPPQRIATTSCLNRASVVRFDSGIMFGTHRGHSVLRPGGQIEMLDQVALAPSDVVAAVASRRDGDVFLFGSNVTPGECSDCDATSWCYLLNRWAGFVTGNIGLGANPVVAADEIVIGTDPYDTVLVFTTSAAYKALAAGEYNVEVQTAWIKPGGHQGDAFIREVLLHAYRIGSGNTVDVVAYYDYSTSDTDAQTFSAGEITPEVKDGQYTLRYVLPRCDVRAVSLKIVTADIPITLTLVCGIDPNVKRRYLINR